MFSHKLESARVLWFKLYCQRWRTSQGHRQSHTGKVVISWKQC